MHENFLIAAGDSIYTKPLNDSTELGGMMRKAWNNTIREAQQYNKQFHFKSRRFFNETIMRRKLH